MPFQKNPLSLPLSIKNRLTLRLVLYTIVCSLFFTLVASAFQLYSSYEEEMDKIDQTFLFIQSNYLPIITQSVYDLNEKQIEISLQSLVQIQHINYAEIQLTETSHTAASGNPDLKKDIERELPIHYIDGFGSSTLLGHLTLVSNFDAIYTHLYRRSLEILLATIIQIFPTAFFILLMIQYFLVRHLTYMARYARNIDLGKLESELILKRTTLKRNEDDELNQVVSAINDLQKRVKKDINQRKEIEKELRQNQKQLLDEKHFSDKLINSLPAIFYLINEKDQLTRWNQALRENTGYDKDTLQNASIYHFFEEKDHDYIKFILQDTRSEGGFYGELVLKNADDSLTPYYFSSTYIKGDENSYILGMGIDITAQKAAEKELYLTKYTIDHGSNAMYRIQENGRISYANQSACLYTGLTIEQLVGKHFGEIDPYFKQSRFDDLWKRLQRSHTLNIESVQKSVGNKEIPVAINISYHKFENNAYLFLNVEDISEQRRTEAERSRLGAVLEQSYDNVVITDLQGRIEYVNASFERTTGYSRVEVFGKNPKVLKSGKHDEAFYKDLWDTISSGQVWNGTFINRSKDRKLFRESAIIFPVMDSSGKISKYASVKRDITEQFILEEQLRQTQKMEAIGTLAGGVAHDFNNILGAVFAYTQLAQRNIPEIPATQKIDGYLTKILSAASRAKDLVDQILAFSRKSEFEPQLLDLKPLLKESIKFMRASLPSKITINLQIDSNPTQIKGDYTQIHQVIMNLCTNASHAMEEQGGELDVSLKNHQISIKSMETCYLEPGDYIQLSIRDNGVGMDEATQTRIFEPFYTTKEKGKGTGLGLAVVHGIVQKHDGGIYVYSTPGLGTRFDIYLPSSGSSSEETHRPLMDRKLPGGTESLLLVDDELEIIQAYRDMLEMHGYTIKVFTNSQQALEEIKAPGNNYQLVITDYTMPGMDGIELSTKIHKFNQELPILMISGLSDSLKPEVLENTGINMKLSKPVEIELLLRTIREILDTPR